jgi:hypothetical protein
MVLDHRGRHTKQLEPRLFQLFSDNLAVVLDFLTLLDKHNIRTLSANLKLISLTGKEDIKVTFIYKRPWKNEKQKIPHSSKIQ